MSKAIRQDAKTGMTVQELMDKYAIARSTVHRHILASPRSRRKSGSFL
jgi:DNA-binding IclR family transcriptional regulator